MGLSIFVTLAVLVGAGYVIYKVARKLWRKVDVEEKIEDIESLHETYDNVKDIDLERVKQEKKTVKKVLNS